MWPYFIHHCGTLLTITLFTIGLTDIGCQAGKHSKYFHKSMKAATLFIVVWFLWAMLLFGVRLAQPLRC